MSSVVQSQTRMKAQRTVKARVGLWDLMHAKLIRSRRTFTWGVIGATFTFTTRTIILANASIPSGVVTKLQWSDNALVWMYVYAGGLVASLGLLTEAVAQQREQRWRQGGTAWCAVAPRRAVGARLAVLSLSALAYQVVLVAPVVGHAPIVDNGQGPWDRYLLFATHMRIVVTGACARGMAAFHVLRAVSVGVAPVLGFVRFVAGMVQAEWSNWWILPWAWTARVPLPPLGIYGGSVLLETDSSVWDYPLPPGLLLTIGLTPAGIGLAVLCGVSGGAGASTSSVSWLSRLLPGERDAVNDQSEAVSVQSLEQALGVWFRSIPIRRVTSITRMAHVLGPCSAILVMAGALPWIVWAAPAILLLAFLGILHAVYPSGYRQSFLELMGVPVAAALVSTTVWGRF